MPYPVILGGDHAAFEIEHAHTPDNERPDWPLPSFDATDWAAAFCNIATKLGYKDAEGKPVDEGWMIGWFANALMRGYDERSGQIAGPLNALSDAMWQLLDDMGKDGQSVCLQAKAQARIAFEPFQDADAPTPMDLEEAKRIIAASNS